MHLSGLKRPSGNAGAGYRLLNAMTSGPVSSDEHLCLPDLIHFLPRPFCSAPTVMATFWKPRGDTQRSYSYQVAETGFAPRGHPKPALTPPQLSEKSHEGSDGTPVWLPSL